MAAAYSTSMLEAHVASDTTVTLHRSPVPILKDPHQILIEVHATACNPKDWKLPAGILKTIAPIPNSGDDIAGIVVSVGSAVINVRPGDRVAALHQLGAEGGSYAEFAIGWDHLCWKIPMNMSFEAASCTPMGCVMAGLGLFGMLRVDFNNIWHERPQQNGHALLVYGAASNVGAYAVKLAKLMGIAPLVCIAGNGMEFVQSLLDPAAGDRVVDYRGKSSHQLIDAIKAASGTSKIMLAFDAVSDHGSYRNIAEVLDQKGRITLVLPQKIEGLPESVEQSSTMAGSLWSQGMTRKDSLGRLGLEKGGREFGLVLSALIGEWLSQGRLDCHPYEVVDGGLAGLEGALKRLRRGEVSGKKLVVSVRASQSLRSGETS